VPGSIRGLDGLRSHGKRGPAESADYAPFFRNRKLAVIEAKPWDKPLTEGLG
jgi:type I restriction enzyme R subunit